MTEIYTHQCSKHGEYNSCNAKPLFWKDCPECVKETKEYELTEQAKLAEERRTAGIKQRIERSGIPERFLSKTLSGYAAKNKGQSSVLDFSNTYANDFSEIVKSGRSVIFCGKPGTGKTHIAVAIGLHVINQGYSVGFTTTQRMMRRLKDTMRKNADETESYVIGLFTDIDLLIIDEVGVQFGSDYEKNAMFDILNGRYENKLPTILISNLPPSEIKLFIGERVFDRLREDGGVCIPFDWASHRGGIE